MHDSWEEDKISMLTGIWKKLTPTIMDDFKAFKTSEVELISDIVEIASIIDYAKHLTVWVTTTWKILKEMEYQIALPAPEKPVCRSRSNS